MICGNKNYEEKYLLAINDHLSMKYIYIYEELNTTLCVCSSLLLFVHCKK